jgi:hypothetical protein
VGYVSAIATRLSVTRVLVASVVLGIVSIYVWKERAAHLTQQREAAYQAALQRYSAALAPGITRRDVEEYLRAEGTRFMRTSRVEPSTAYSDVVQIGQDDPPWHCSEKNVYIAFGFAPARASKILIAEAHDSDSLATVVIVRWLEGCL